MAWFDPFDPDLFGSQPSPDLIKVEFPLRSNFLSGASPKEPVVDVPGPNIQFFRQIVSVHFPNPALATRVQSETKFFRSV